MNQLIDAEAVTLTNNCQVDGEIPRRRCTEIHPTTVNAFVVQLDPVYVERGRSLVCHEVSSRTEYRLIDLISNSYCYNPNLTILLTDVNIIPSLNLLHISVRNSSTKNFTISKKLSANTLNNFVNITSAV